MKELIIGETFAGYGSHSLALKYLGIPYKNAFFSEINNNAIKAYEALHGKVKNLGDIKTITNIPYCDLLITSAPCQDYSIQGKQAGGEKGSGTRSSLIWEVERILRNAKKNNNLPKYLMLENVKNLLGPKHKPNFLKWLDVLDEIGYNTYYNVISGVECGIPQKRERLFAISIRKDIDDNTFSMNKDFLLEGLPSKYSSENISYKDFLENENEIVDKEIYLKTKDLKKMKEFGAPYSFGGRIIKDDIYTTIVSNYGVTNGNSGKIIRNHYKTMKAPDGTDTLQLSILTPKEVLRLMGLQEDDINIFYNLFENKKDIYKLAGNSIIIPVMEVIFRKLFKDYE